eukprot:scaffold15944_cov115-Isochrysis_galbana.AAC.4
MAGGRARRAVGNASCQPPDTGLVCVGWIEGCERLGCRGRVSESSSGKYVLITPEWAPRVASKSSRRRYARALPIHMIHAAHGLGLQAV